MLYSFSKLFPAFKALGNKIGHRIKLKLFVSNARWLFCLLLFSSLYGCHHNLGRMMPNSSVQDAHVQQDAHTQNVDFLKMREGLQVVQEDPSQLNTLRISVGGQSVSLLHAAMMLCENSDAIVSLLNQGADIKAADRECDGILHALMANHRLCDEQKAEVVNYCFCRVDADDIQSNNTVLKNLRSRSREVTRISPPWVEALKKGERETAMAIVNHMSFSQARANGLFYAIKEGIKYAEANVGDKNLIQVLLDKQPITSYDPQIVEPLLRRARPELPEAIVSTISEYGYNPVCIINNNLGCDFAHRTCCLWDYAWIKNEDVETSIRIIQKMSYVTAPNLKEEIAAQARSALTFNRNYWADGWGAENIAEWQRIKAAFITIGVPEDSLPDRPDEVN